MFSCYFKIVFTISIVPISIYFVYKKFLKMLLLRMKAEKHTRRQVNVKCIFFSSPQLVMLTSRRLWSRLFDGVDIDNNVIYAQPKCTLSGERAND